MGGLYGVSLRGAFFGESMFSIVRDASKVALVHLVAQLIGGGYRLLDTQFITEHLTQFGAIEISRKAYQRRLAAALQVEGRFQVGGDSGGAAGAGAAAGGGTVAGLTGPGLAGCDTGAGASGLASGLVVSGAAGLGVAGAAGAGRGGGLSGAAALQVISQAS